MPIARENGQRRVLDTKNDTKSLGINTNFGVFIGTVKANDDSQNMGRIRVHIPDLGDDHPDKPESWITVSYASPFAGSTSIFEQGQNYQDYKDTMKPYGLWTPQPDIDTQVLVTFAGGRIDMGFWFACLYNRGTQVTVPGIPAKKTYDGDNIPAAPKNKKDEDTDLEKYVTHTPLYDALRVQGLLEDTTRGITTSSATREAPSKVLGILTPGQHQFVMDDGDAKGQNRLIRLRTTNGVQLLLDDVSGHIYMVSRMGNSWVELSSDGQIHLYGANSINIRSEGDVNIRADMSVNIEAGDEINLSAAKNVTLQSGANIQTISKSDTFITSGQQSHINSVSGHYETAAVIHMNGPAAGQATPLEPNSIPINQNVTESICTVVPEHEPWAGHIGNINPIGCGNKQMKADPDPEQTPRQPEPDEAGAPINSNACAFGDSVRVNDATTTDSTIDMIREENEFTPVNVDDGDGQSIGYGSEYSEEGNPSADDYDYYSDSSTAIPIGDDYSGNSILKNALSAAKKEDKGFTVQIPGGSVNFSSRAAYDAWKENPKNVISQNIGGIATLSLPDQVAAKSPLSSQVTKSGKNIITNEIPKIMSEGVTPERANQMLLNDITQSENAVKATLKAAGINEIPQNVFDGLVSFHNQTGDISYAYVGNEKISLTGLYSSGEWSRVASFIAADERDRSRRIKEATIIATNKYPQSATQASIVAAGYEKTTELLSKGLLNQQTGTPATMQQAIAATTSYFKQIGSMPPGINSETRMNVINGTFKSSLFRQDMKWGY